MNNPIYYVRFRGPGMDIALAITGEEDDFEAIEAVLRKIRRDIAECHGPQHDCPSCNAQRAVHTL